MDHHLAFLHTAKVHVETFSKLVAEISPNISVRHDVNEGLLEQARKTGITPEMETRICKAMQEAASTGASVVVCTCSTIGGIAERSGQGFTPMRIDRAMADEAVNLGQRILIVAALESTLGSTRDLVEDSARKLGKNPDIQVLHIQDAWKYFEAGDSPAYLQTIAQALRENWQAYEVIVLAQASMAKVIALCEEIEIPILSSPELGVNAALSIL